MEGDSEGPLTGHDRDGKWVWSDCATALGLGGTGGATGGGGVDAAAAKALKDSEKSVKAMEDAEGKAMANEKKMLGDEKKAFNVISKCRRGIEHGRKHNTRNASDATPPSEHKISNATHDSLYTHLSLIHI